MAGTRKGRGGTAPKKERVKHNEEKTVANVNKLTMADPPSISMRQKHKTTNGASSFKAKIAKSRSKQDPPEEVYEETETSFVDEDQILKMGVTQDEDRDFQDYYNTTETESDEESEDENITFKSSKSSNNNATCMEEGEIEEAGSGTECDSDEPSTEHTYEQ